MAWGWACGKCLMKGWLLLLLLSLLVAGLKGLGLDSLGSNPAYPSA